MDVEKWRHFVNIGKKSKVIFSDNMLGMKRLNNESIHLTFTSPPYWNFVEYASKHGSGTEDNYNEYILNLKSVFGMVYKKTIPGGRFVINVCNMNSRSGVDGNEAFYFSIVADVTQIIKNAGFLFFDECVWVKGGATAGAWGGKPMFGSYPNPPTPKLLNSTFENILVFKKEGKRPKPILNNKQASKIRKEDWFEWTKGIWHIHPDQKKAEHPATFPIEIPKRIVRMYSFVGDRVLDPFAGSGTTVIAAEKWGREGIGFEIARAYENEIALKAEEYLAQLSLPGIDIE